MAVEFTTGVRPGVIGALLRASYRELVETDTQWAGEQANWDAYDREISAYPDAIGACLFLTRLDGCIAGFASWDPRQRPTYVIGHNCILPEFRGRGLGQQQIEEVLRRFYAFGAETARVSTNDHPFFVPAQRMYLGCGFREVRRVPWSRNPRWKIIEYEKSLAAAAAF